MVYAYPATPYFRTKKKKKSHSNDLFHHQEDASGRYSSIAPHETRYTSRWSTSCSHTFLDYHQPQYSVNKQTVSSFIQNNCLNSHDHLKEDALPADSDKLPHLKFNNDFPMGSMPVGDEKQ